jgi:hypothetical protein
MRQEIKQLRILGQQCGGPGEQWDGVAPCDICQQRHDLVAGPVATKTRFRVGRVDDRAEAQGCHQSGGLGPPQGQYGPPHLPEAAGGGSHATQAV